MADSQAGSRGSAVTQMDANTRIDNRPYGGSFPDVAEMAGRAGEGFDGYVPPGADRSGDVQVAGPYTGPTTQVWPDVLITGSRQDGYGTAGSSGIRAARASGMGGLSGDQARMESAREAFRQYELGQMNESAVDHSAALNAAAALGGEFSLLSADLPSDIASGYAGPAGAMVRDPAGSVVGLGKSVYNNTIGGLAGMAVKGGAYLTAGEQLMSGAVLGIDTRDDAWALMGAGQAGEQLILAQPRSEGQAVGMALGDVGFALGATAGVVRGGVGIYNDWRLGNVGRTGAADYLSRFSSTELDALRTAGLSDVEIARHVELSGDIHLFRGTSPGWAGSPGAQATAVSATTDPYIATVFALEARGQAGQAVVQFGPRSSIGTFDMGNWMAVQEREVGVLMTSRDFAARAPSSVPVDTARQVLGEMGMPELPYTVASPSARSMLLDAAPKMTPEQVAEFIQRINKTGPR